jgi:thiosulfate/3-mercaptopyruvate sulfurtransferase
MKWTKSIFAFIIGLLLLQVGFASDFIDAKDLFKIMKDDNVVVVSAQKPASYNDFHITGSLNLPPKILTDDDPVPYVLKTVDEMEKIIGSKGISEKNLIIVYDEGSSKYSGRLYWVLKYLGVEQVKILNGGLESWKAIRKPVTSAATKLPATIFKANVQPQFVAEFDEVVKATGNDNFVIIDARSDSEYEGTNETSLRKGHIPNAVHIEYKDVLTSKGMIKSAEQLKELYESKGITPEKIIIIYCKTSVRAAIEFAALHSILGYNNVKVYDGAFSEWSASTSTKVMK